MTDTVSTFPAATRPIYWTVRRELWENRSIYLAPAIVGLLEVLGIVISALRFPDHVQIDGELSGDRAQAVLGAIYGALGMPVVVTALIVAAFYCLDTLYSERRDRSILFWKSLPVSDTVTVLGKALIPFVILPVVTFAVISITQIVTLSVSALILKFYGLSAPVLSTVPFATITLTLAYALAAMALWYAPLYGWLFLVSAFARRKTILWALLPPLGVCVVEKFAFDTDHFYHLLGDRFLGFLGAAFNVENPERFQFSLDRMTPLDLVSAGGLWGGLAVAALFFFGAIQLRRYRGPV